MYIRLVAERLAGNSRVTVLTGAGVSAASGVPTFRGAGGLWKQFRPEELATPQAFARDPALVWGWYAWRRDLIANCRPNAAHDVLASWSRRFEHFTLVTQNVDGLHEAAGTANVVRLHGSIWENRCSVPCAAGATAWDARTQRPQRAQTTAGTDSSAASTTSAFEDMPRCPHCGAVARPAVVWFGESLDRSVMARADEATQCDVFITVGTSAIVYPAAGLLHEAKRRRAFTVEINPHVTNASGAVDIAIAKPAEVALPDIDAMIA